ncbi:MAG: M56 family metallopeptidase [Pirellulales bacterium]|nr:M56 family metallopeptidase [Pirellulales bacterium]
MNGLLEWLDASGWLLIDVAWKSLALLALVVLIEWACLRGRPLAADALWSATVLALLALPLCCWLMPQTSLRLPVAMGGQWSGSAQRSGTDIPLVSDSESKQEASTARGPVVGDPMKTGSVLEPEASSSAKGALKPDDAAPARDSRAGFPPGIRALISIFYFLGVIGFAIRLLSSSCDLARMIRGADKVASGVWIDTVAEYRKRLGIRRPVAVLHCREISTPLTVGIFRPLIIIPSSILNQPAGAIVNVVLLHELTHIARRDYLALIGAKTTELLYWFNPLLWFATRRMRHVREAICDGYCVSSLGGRDNYIDVLLDFSQRLSIKSRPTTLGLAMVRLSRLERRLANMSELPRFSAASWSQWTFGFGVLIATALIASSAMGQTDGAGNSDQRGAGGEVSNARQEDSKLTEALQRQIVAALQAEYDARLAEFRGGRASVNRLLQVNQELYLAQAAAGRPSERRQFAQAMFQRAEQVEKMAQLNFDHGTGTVQERLAATTAKLRAQLELQRIQASGGGDNDPADGESQQPTQPDARTNSKRKCFIIGNSPYYQVLSDMARRRGLAVGPSFNTKYDKFLPQAKGNVLMIETHRGVPVVDTATLERYFPQAAGALSSGHVTIEGTEIFFVDFDKLVPSILSEKNLR